MITAICLVVLGLCFGSFVNALVWRLHEQSKAKTKKAKQKLSVAHGRSMCVNCKHQLSTADLIPVFSWLWLKGKCRYCKKPISWQYPLVELATAVVFAGSYLLWPVPFDNGQWLLLATWLACSVGLMALLIYDAKWFLLPSKIIYPTLAIALTGRLAYIIFFADDRAHSFWWLVLSILVSSGIFWILFQVSQGKWIGFGDVRLGLVTGTLLADPAQAAGMIFIASLLGTLSAVPDLIRHKKTMASKLPYGPYLITATAIMVLWGETLVDWYKNLLRI
jgi:prepilin signal peptidase PulO-like enzyme (type II secretory pathway)